MLDDLFVLDAVAHGFNLAECDYAPLPQITHEKIEGSAEIDFASIRRQEPEIDGGPGGMA